MIWAHALDRGVIEVRSNLRNVYFRQPLDREIKKWKLMQQN